MQADIGEGELGARRGFPANPRRISANIFGAAPWNE